MPEYEPANQQAADDASSISSLLSGTLWSLGSSIISIASSILPNQRYDPVQQQPDDNSSIGSAEQDNQIISATRDVTSLTSPPELGVNDDQPSQKRSNTRPRARRLRWWVRDLRLLLFSTTDSRRAKLVNWIILPLILVLYYLIFTSVTANRGETEGVFSAVCLMLIIYHRVQAIRVLVPLSQSPQSNNLGLENKFIFWSWVANHVVYFAVEVLMNIGYWVEYMSETWSIAIICTVCVFYCFASVTTLNAVYNKKLFLINFPTVEEADYFKTGFMPLICFLVWTFLLIYDKETYFFYGTLLSTTLWVPATTR